MDFKRIMLLVVCGSLAFGCSSSNNSNDNGKELVDYKQTSNRNAVAGDIRCDNMRERSNNETLDVKGRFTCDNASL